MMEVNQFISLKIECFIILLVLFKTFLKPQISHTLEFAHINNILALAKQKKLISFNLMMYRKRTYGAVNLYFGYRANYHMWRLQCALFFMNRRPLAIKLLF